MGIQKTGVAAARPFIFTSIGKKFVMGVTGLIWAGFVFGHMAGNLLVFVGPDAYNKYGHGIVTSGILIPAEIVLVTALLIHVGLAINLTMENRRARGTRYAATSKTEKAARPFSKTMAIQGSLILFFVITHLITFKYGTYYETVVDGVKMRDLHRLMVEVFTHPAAVGWYVVAMVVLGFHLSHGFGSVFQSLGLKNERTEDKIRLMSWGYAIVVAAGFLAQPIYIHLMN